MDSRVDIWDIAKVCHEVNRTFCKSIGDHSQPAWEDAALWQKQSAMNGVVYRIENQNSTPADQHDSWSKEKLEDGWIYGPIKDASLKTHPCLVNYDQLPKDQQTKDYLFMTVVDAMRNL